MKTKGKIIGIITLLMLICAMLTTSVFAMSDTTAGLGDMVEYEMITADYISSDLDSNAVTDDKVSDLDNDVATNEGRPNSSNNTPADIPGSENDAITGIPGSENDAITGIPGVENGITEDEEATEDASGENDVNIFNELFTLVGEYSGEIFSLLSLLASLILAYLYKSGLTPIVKNALSALGTAVTSIKESTERGEEKAGAVTGALTERLDATEAVISKLSEAIDHMSRDLEAKEMEANERLSLRIVLRAQIDMLYEIFMTSALPEYKKSEVGERIAKMKEAIGIDETRD